MDRRNVSATGLPSTNRAYAGSVVERVVQVLVELCCRAVRETEHEAVTVMDGAMPAIRPDRVTDDPVRGPHRSTLVIVLSRQSLLQQRL
jgi:hypothetical protein